MRVQKDLRSMKKGVNEPVPTNKILNTRWPNVAYHTLSLDFPLQRGPFGEYLNER